MKRQLEAVRINTAVFYDLEFKGVDIREHFPLIAEGRGLCLSIYAMKRNGDVITAQKSTESEAWIPSDLVQLKQFLRSGSIFFFLSLSASEKSENIRHSNEAISSKSIYPVEKKGVHIEQVCKTNGHPLPPLK